MDFWKLKKDCFEMKRKALDMALSTRFGAHIGGGFSAMEILAALYAVANIPSVLDEQRDRIIISKGHCVLAYYTALWKKGYLTEDDLETFETDGTQFYGHPHRDLDKGIEFTGGSLGLGISYGAGVAKACKNKGLNNRIYILVGDGEMNEGIVWEALMAIAHFKLNNVTVIVDRNHYQLDGPTYQVMNLFSLEEKFSAFGFEVETIDGHSLEDLCSALIKFGEKPRAVLAETVKAHGLSFLEHNKLSHQCILSKKKYEQAVEDIENANANE